MKELIGHEDSFVRFFSPSSNSVGEDYANHQISLELNVVSIGQIKPKGRLARRRVSQKTNGQI